MGVLKRMQTADVVLAIQDTTDFNFTSHPATQGLGFINQTEQQGLKVHSCLAFSGQGQPFGVLHQYCWTRAQRRGKKGQRARKPIEQKESYRWLTTLRAAEQDVPDGLPMVHIGDREADIFELFVEPRRADSELLIRLEHNRKVQHELATLWPTIHQAPVVGTTTLELQRNPKRPARQASLTMRALQVTLEVPRNRPRSRNLSPVCVTVLLVEESEPPSDGSEPIHWMLLTTLPVETFEQAWQCVVWYSYRWLIERFHFTLKSGCRIEALQLQSKDRLLKALATYNIVAWQLMWLTYEARIHPEGSCEAVLKPQEWRLLRRRFEPKNRSSKPPTLRQVVRWMAQLGGFLARKGDGEPGVKTLWRGLNRFHHLLEGAQLATQT